MYDLGFLHEFGINDLQIKIYEFLIKNRFANINQIKTALNFSYAQVRDNSNQLEKVGLITSSDGKPKNYILINPEIALTNLLKNKTDRIFMRIKSLKESILIEESKQGICTRNITFYHHSNLNTGIDHLYKLINQAENKIILSSLPPILLKKLERALYNAFLKGVKIKIFFSKLDFEKVVNYFEYITETLKNIEVKIVEINEKTCRFVNYNDLIVNEGVILIDDYLNSILFLDDNCFHFNGFFAPNIVKSSFDMLKAKTVLKSVKINPDCIQKVLDIVKCIPEIKTRELGIQSNLAGTKLREVLEYLIKTNLIKEEVIKGNVGRPKKVYSLIE